ncbi:MAG: hypothetical protein WC779_04450 [Candidatus Omnitrophota bacterium]|jgi:uncharacterized cysteine cluster protein YcgN (CxxCxxCC family)
MPDSADYIKEQKEWNDRYESLCKRCGICCGSTNDACVNLARDAEGKYYCKSYETRFGPQLTVSGKKFTCVEIRDVIKNGIPNPDCGYTKVQEGF